MYKRQPLSLIEEMTDCPVVQCGKEEYTEIRTVFEQLRAETGVESVKPAEESGRLHSIVIIAERLH